MEGGVWLQLARLFEGQGVFASTDPSFYQSRVHAALMVQNKWDHEDELGEIIQAIFAIVNPVRYNEVKRKRDAIKKEQLGFEKINYVGEGDTSWQELAEDFKGMDLKAIGFETNEIHFDGEGLAKFLRENGFNGSQATQ